MQRSDLVSGELKKKSPLTLLAAIFAASLALVLIPGRYTQPMRDGWREAMRPGLVVLAASSESIKIRWNEFRRGNSQSVDAEQKIAALDQHVRQLQMELLLVRSERNRDMDGEASDANGLPALLVSRTISARVLGRQAQMFLPSRDLLDVGSAQGAKTKSLVIDEGTDAANRSLVDEGRDAAVEPGRMVLAGNRVWGKIAEVGPHTSSVRRVNDLGYRDVVQLARQRDGKLHFVARGMLVGRGERWSKIELVETKEAVTVGDLVFTTDNGLADSPLLYGRVARVERKPGAGHWEIWMEPAVAEDSPPGRVAVLRMELNPARVAGGGSGTAIGE